MDSLRVVVLQVLLLQTRGPFHNSSMIFRVIRKWSTHSSTREELSIFDFQSAYCSSFKSRTVILQAVIINNIFMDLSLCTTSIFVGSNKSYPSHPPNMMTSQSRSYFSSQVISDPFAMQCRKPKKPASKNATLCFKSKIKNAECCTVSSSNDAQEKK